MVSRNLFLEILFPKWLLRWGTPLMRQFHAAHEELRVSFLSDIAIKSE